MFGNHCKLPVEITNSNSKHMAMSHNNITFFTWFFYFKLRLSISCFIFFAHMYMYILQVKSNLRSICSNLGQFDFFCFCGKQKNNFGTFNVLFIPLLHFIFTLLASPTIPSLLPQHPSPYSFYLNAYLVSLELGQTFGFPLDSCPDALP